MKRTIKLVGNGMLMGIVVTVALFFTVGPRLGLALRRTGDQLVALGGDTPLRTAAEVETVVQAVADDVVNARVTALLGRRGDLPPAIVRR